MDVLVERKIKAPPAEVARVMFDPWNDPRWIGGAKAVEPLYADALAVGSRVRRRGEFLGRKFAWVTEVKALEPGRRLEMTFVEGPMKGGVTYEVRPTYDGGSVASVRNHAKAGFEAPGMAWMVKRSVAKDLDRLAKLVEDGG